MKSRLTKYSTVHIALVDDEEDLAGFQVEEVEVSEDLLERYKTHFEEWKTIQRELYEVTREHGCSGLEHWGLLP